MTEIEQTFGQKRVRLAFNPSDNAFVGYVKSAQADNIDVYERAKNDATDPEAKRLWALAQTAAEEAAMWAVKAATYPGS
jgi:hypothetical protein